MSQEQERELVDWQEVQRLANKLGSLGSHFTVENRRALELVFDAAGERLIEEQRIPTSRPADARFIPGSNEDETLVAFKVSELYQGGPAEDRDDEKPPDDDSFGK